MVLYALVAYLVSKELAHFNVPNALSMNTLIKQLP